MNSKNRYRDLVLNVLLWLALYLVWIFAFQNRELTFKRTLGVEFCYLIFIALNFYFNIYFLVPKFLNRSKFIWFAILSFSFVIVMAWLRAETALFINTTFYNIRAVQVDFTRLYFNSLLNISIWTGCLVTAKVILDKIKFQRYTELIEKERVLNELNFLKAQNNPHFLFNSLNSIYFQIDKNNSDARETLMRLSEMLRYQLYECDAETISIEKETAYLKNYMELQKLRLNTNYNILFTMEDNVKNFLIAPLLILPLIENAFKYVSHFTDKSNEIRMAWKLKLGWFECVICNTIERALITTPAQKGGIGLTNLKRRLELLYPDKHKLIFDVSESNYTVRLALKTNEN